MSLQEHKKSATEILNRSYAAYVDKAVLKDIAALLESVIDSTAEEIVEAIVPDKIIIAPEDESNPSMAEGWNEAVRGMRDKWEKFTT